MEDLGVHKGTLHTLTRSCSVLLCEVDLNGFLLLFLLRFKEGSFSKGFILQMSLGISKCSPQEDIIWGSCLLEMQVRRERSLEGEKVLEAEVLKCIICLGPSLSEIKGL